MLFYWQQHTKSFLNTSLTHSALCHVTWCTGRFFGISFFLQFFLYCGMSKSISVGFLICWFFSFAIEHITNIFLLFFFIILWAPWTLFLFSFTGNFTLWFGLDREKNLSSLFQLACPKTEASQTASSTNIIEVFHFLLIIYHILP